MCWNVGRQGKFTKNENIRIPIDVNDAYAKWNYTKN